MTRPRLAKPTLPWPTRSRADHEQARERTLRDATRLLTDGLCAVCRERDESERRWLGYFVTESHTDEGVRARLIAAAGFCPAHTRHLLADASLPWLMPQVHDAALTGGRPMLEQEHTRPAPCPACVTGQAAEQRALDTLLRALDQPVVLQAVLEAAVCLPHTAALAAQADLAQTVQMTTAACDRLAGPARDHEVVWLAGTDPDAPHRPAWHTGLDALLPRETEYQQHSVLDRWDADAAMDCCPLCLAEHRTTHRFLTWAATATGRGQPAREETGLCPPHLHDLATIGGPNTTAVIQDNRDTWNRRLTRYQQLITARRTDRRDANAYLLAAPRCSACDARHAAGRRQAALLDAALLDPVRARTFEHAHGICLHHALTGPTLAPLAHDVLTARLALLRWEVDEVLRKQDWHTRYEPRGAETTVTVRAPTVLDGRVYAGLPVPPAARPALALTPNIGG
ncbi:MULTISPECIES: hypothetical protein [unclassified Streptomyces]|uniref:hypothetical protein n=1 Tax=unclassified Streptomyces TaxID=2593676 RepID=UPI001BB06FC1|nr:hypothetical protein [Streptomyces sp. V17-9]QUW89968.1 hypothetical protein KE639_01144 [Streptomyces sp. V17-9]